MAKAPETKFKEPILEELRRIPYSYWEKIQQASLRGTPDIIGCVRGKFVAIELKSARGKADPLQTSILQQIANAGGYAAILLPHDYKPILAEIAKL